MGATGAGCAGGFPKAREGAFPPGGEEAASAAHTRAGSQSRWSEALVSSLDGGEKDWPIAVGEGSTSSQKERT